MLQRRLGKRCLMESSDNEYGVSEGFMRLFPHEVFPSSIEHLICTEVADFVFLNDPARLLEAHLKSGDKQGIVSYPAGQACALQVFSLQRMRAARWSAKVQALFQKHRRKGSVKQFCSLAECEGVQEMRKRHPKLFSLLHSRWAYTPRVLSMKGYGIHSFLTFKSGASTYSSPFALDIWDRRGYPGLVDAFNVQTYCQGFADAVLFWLFTKTNPFDFRHLLPDLLLAASEVFSYKKSHTFVSTASQDEMIQCGHPVDAIHLLRQFHRCSPWSLRFLGAWSNDLKIYVNADPWLTGCPPQELRYLPLDKLHASDFEFPFAQVDWSWHQDD